MVSVCRIPCRAMTIAGPVSRSGLTSLRMAGTSLDIGAFNTSNQNPLLVDTCGTWLLFNNLFGVTPFVDFCKVTGNVCNEQGGVIRVLALGLSTPMQTRHRCCALHVQSSVQGQPRHQDIVSSIFDWSPVPCATFA